VATATPVTAPNFDCRPGIASAGGGQSIGVESRVAVTLPSPGDYRYIFIPAGEEGILIICHLQSDSSLGVEGGTCRETGRTVNEPEGEEVLNQIVASARCPVLAITAVHTATATLDATSPTIQATAIPPSPLPQVRPPETGDAGLR
jgi:hypothetical protein